MAIVRRSKKVSNMLIEAYSPGHKKAMSFILDAKDVSDEVAIKAIKKGFDSPTLDWEQEYLRLRMIHP